MQRRQLRAPRFMQVLYSLLALSISLNIFLYTRWQEELGNVALLLQQRENSVVIEDEKEIYVHIGGAVNESGVYIVLEGTRIFDLIEKAGGFAEEADKERLNLAAVLNDGDYIMVPHLQNAEEEVKSGTGSVNSLGQININYAGVSELTQLSGIGNVKAEAIIEYREKHGFFKNKRDLLLVPGIGPSIYAKIEDKISIH